MGVFKERVVGFWRSLGVERKLVFVSIWFDF